MVHKVPLFSSLDDADLQFLRSQMSEQKLEVGRVLEPQELWVITAGSADWIVPDSAGQELVLQTLECGDHFGELTLVADDIQGQARIKVRQELSALRLEREQFQAFMQSRPDALFAALKTVARKLHSLDDNLRSSISRNVYEEGYRKISRGQKLADRFTTMIGSWPFILSQTVCLVIWMLWNHVEGTTHWDPYPFIFLNLALSFQSAYAAPIIMMSQNRQAEKDRLAAEIDHQVNLKSEMAGAALLRRLSQLERSMQAPS